MEEDTEQKRVSQELYEEKSKAHWGGYKSRKSSMKLNKN